MDGSGEQVGAGDVPAAGAPGVARDVGVGELARRLGVDVRTVRAWTQPERCPGGGPCVAFEWGVSGGRRGKRFNEQEVRSWCRAMGLTVSPAEGETVFAAGVPAPAPVVPSAPIAAAAAVAPPLANAPTAPAAMIPDEKAELDLLADVPIGSEREAFRESLMYLRHTLAGVQRTLRTSGAAGISPNMFNQLAGAAEKASKEIRLLDDAAADLARKRGEVVSKIGAERVGESLIDAVIAGEQLVAQELGQALRDAGCQIGEGAARLSAEAFDRVVAIKAGGLLERQRGECVAGLRRAAGELDRLAGAGGTTRAAADVASHPHTPSPERREAA